MFIANFKGVGCSKHSHHASRTTIRNIPMTQSNLRKDKTDKRKGRTVDEKFSSFIYAKTTLSVQVKYGFFSSAVDIYRRLWWQSEQVWRYGGVINLLEDGK